MTITFCVAKMQLTILQDDILNHFKAPPISLTIKPLTHVAKPALFLVKPTMQLALSFFSLLLCICLLHSTHAAAETNVSDVEIIISDEPVSGDLVGDPVQDFISKSDTNDTEEDKKRCVCVSITNT